MQNLPKFTNVYTEYGSINNINIYFTKITIKLDEYFHTVFINNN